MVYHMFPLYLALVIFHLGFEGGALVLIASVPDHCFSFTFYLAQNICTETVIRWF